MLGGYIGYRRPNDLYSCDLLIGKSFLAAENLSLPQKELHGLSLLANLKMILENCLGQWIEECFTFSDSEISLCWAIYEKVKLTTFVRNRVINIRTKLDFDKLYHVDGKYNPVDVGTRPDLINADSVKPGSVWLSGHPWMKESIEKARQNGIIKSIEDIKLSNDKKKVSKEGLTYETFDESDQGVFGVLHVQKVDQEKMTKLLITSQYCQAQARPKLSSS